MPIQEMIPKIPVNPKILTWARHEANLTIASAAAKAKIHDLKARPGTETLLSSERVELWEKGIQTPTFSQLEQLAKAYRRPLLTFFLEAPPKKETRLKDFRTIKKADEEIAFSAEFSALVRQVEAVQTSIKDILLSSNTKPLQFVGSAKEQNNANKLALTIREALGYTIDNQKKAGDSERVFSDIRNSAEKIGTFIMVQGNLGSHHTNLEPDIFRGLAISDELAPFIVINPNDAKTARVFTLIHELCHLWRGETGISNLNGLKIERQNELQNELFCDQVAGEFLVPRDSLIQEWDKIHSNKIGLEEKINDLSKKFNVSRLVIARRLVDINEITTDFYWEYFNRCKAEWEELQKIKQAKQKGPPSYKFQVHNRLGERYINTVVSASQQGKISELDAAHLLNVKINNFAKIL